MQLNHYTSKFTKQQFPIVLISDNVSHAANLGSLFRTADAFGIERLILGGSAVELGRKFTKTSRATEQSVVYEQIESLSGKNSRIKKPKITRFIALEITEKSIPISELKLEKKF